MIDFVIDDEGDYESSMTGSDRRQEILKNIKAVSYTHLTLPTTERV